MKKILFLLIAVCLMGCGSDDDNEVKQDYTSFTVTNKTSQHFTNCLAVYYDASGVCKLLGKLGDLPEGVTSSEIKVTDNVTDKFFILSNINGSPDFFVTKLDLVFNLRLNIKNKFLLEGDFRGTDIDRDDPSQYPHELFN